MIRGLTKSMKKVPPIVYIILFGLVLILIRLITITETPPFEHNIVRGSYINFIPPGEAIYFLGSEEDTNTFYVNIQGKNISLHPNQLPYDFNITNFWGDRFQMQVVSLNETPLTDTITVRCVKELP